MRFARILRFLFISLLVLTLSVGLAWQLGHAYLVKRLLISALRTEVGFTSVDIDFSSRYPLTRIRLQGVVIEGTDIRKPSTFLRCANAELVLDLRSFAPNRHRRFLSLIALDSCEIDMRVDSNLVRNYQLFRKYNPDSASIRPTVQIDQLVFTRAHVRYRREGPPRDYDYWVDSADIAIDGQTHHVDVTADMWGTTRYMDLGNYKILVNTPIQLGTRFQLDKGSKCMHFEPALIMLAGSVLAVTGDIRGGKEPYFDLQFRAPNGSIATILNLIPERGLKQIKNFDATGQMDISGSLFGDDVGRGQPHFELTFSCDNASFTNRITGGAITGLWLRGSFTNGRENHARSTFLAIDTVRGNLGGRPFSGSLKVMNLKQPLVDLTFRSRMELVTVANFLNRKLPEGSQGELDFDVAAFGRIRNLAKPDSLTRLNFRGSFELHDVRLPSLISRLMIDSLNAAFRLDSQHLVIKNCQAQLNHQTVNLGGRMDQLVGYLLGLQPNLYGRLYLDSDKLCVDSLLLALPSKQPKKPNSSYFSLPKNLDISLVGLVRNISYKQARFDSLSLSGFVRDGNLNIPMLEIGGPRGHIALSGGLLSRDSTFQSFKASMRIDVRNIQALMQQIRPTASGAEVPFSMSPDSGLQVQSSWTLSGKYLRDTSLSQSHQLYSTLRLDDAKVWRTGKKFGFHSLKLRTDFETGHIRDFIHTPFLLDSIRGFANQYPFEAKIKIKDWVNRSTSVDLFSRVEVAEFLKLINKPIPIDSVRGELEFSTRLEGKLDNLRRFDSLIAINNNGTLLIREGGFRLKSSGLTFRDIDLQAFYDSEGTRFQHLSGRMGRSNFRIYGLARDILPFIFQKGVPLRAEFIFDSDSLDLGELLRRRADKPEKGQLLDFPRVNNLNATFRLKRMRYDSLQIQDFYGKASINERIICADSCNVTFAGGRIGFDGLLDASDTNNIQLNAHIGLKRLSIGDMLRDLERFKLRLREKLNMEGQLTGDFQTSFAFPSSLKIDLDKITLSTSGDVAKGWLYNFKPLQSLKKILGHQPLDTIPFELSFQNATLGDRVALLPYVTLNTPPIQVMAAGSLSLDLAYDFRVAALIAPKKQRLGSPLALQKLDLERLERTLLVLRITDDSETPGKPRISYDFRTAWNRIKGKHGLEPIVRKFKRRSKAKN
jgi:hypothetical protein